MSLFRFLTRASVLREAVECARVAAAESLAIDSATLVQVLDLEAREDLGPDGKRRLLAAAELRFESLGWRVERLGRLCPVHLAEREPLRRLSDILARGGDYADDLVRRIDAVHEYFGLKDRLGAARARTYRPWPLRPEEDARPAARCTGGAG